MKPQFPLYIVSKGRWETPLTARALIEMGVDFRIVVEPDEVNDYADALGRERVLELDMSYKERYDVFDDLGLTKSPGPGPARNFVWDHSISEGHDFHWVMDDNINGFYRLNNNLKLRCVSPSFWRAMEDHVLRYENVAMAGPNYFMFASRKTQMPPFVLNTRIYSCNLIRNDTPFRWRGRYNEDTDLSLRMLKAHWCTIQYNAFLQYKVPTQTVKGGNTAEFYAKEGTLPKSQMQVDMHPDVSRLVWKFGRWHHEVNYRPFKVNRLIRRPNLDITAGTDDYGMRLLPYGDARTKADT